MINHSTPKSQFDPPFENWYLRYIHHKIRTWMDCIEIRDCFQELFVVNYLLPNSYFNLLLLIVQVWLYNPLPGLHFHSVLQIGNTEMKYFLLFFLIHQILKMPTNFNLRQMKLLSWIIFMHQVWTGRVVCFVKNLEIFQL